MPASELCGRFRGFLLAASKGLVALTGSGGCGGWSNWSGNVRCAPERTVLPKNEAELRAAVRLAVRARVVGTGHSFNALACTDHTLIDMRSLNRVLELDEARRRIKVEAGISLRALDEFVASHQLALATEPTIADITAAGAIATASHGTGLALGALAEEVVALEVIDSQGRKHIIEDEDRLRAARVGLGAVGVIYSVSFRLVPAFNLKMYGRVLDESAVFPHLNELLAQNEHVDLFWFLTERKTFLRTYNRTNEPRYLSAPVRDFIEEWIVRTWIAHLGLAVASKIPGITKLLNAVEPAMFPTELNIDRSDRIFHRFPGHQKVVSMEYVIPIEHTLDALAAIKDSLHSTGFYPNMPPYMRFVGGAGDSDLSPLRGRNSCALEVLSYVGFSGWEGFFRDLEPRFLALGGRPHWGKLFYRNPRNLYDAATWKHFEQVRAELDPARKLVNPLVQTLLDP
jgi:FAD/FMN-containing dehydrogenase